MRNEIQRKIRNEDLLLKIEKKNSLQRTETTIFRFSFFLLKNDSFLYFYCIFEGYTFTQSFLKDNTKVKVSEHKGEELSTELKSILLS